MKDLSRVKENGKGCYVEYAYKSGKQKGQVHRVHGQLLICPICDELYFT